MIKNFSLECSYVGHQMKLISQICLNQDCETKICCNACVKQFHKSHIDDLIDVSDYSDFRDNAFLVQSQFKKSISQSICNISQIKSRLEAIIENITINSMLNVEDMNREQLNQEITYILKQQKIQSTIQNDLIALNSLIEKVSRNWKIVQQHISGIYPKGFEKSQLQQNTQCSSTHGQIKIIEIGKQLDIASEQPKRYTFSKLNKHQSIRIADNGEDASYSGRTYGFVLCEQPLKRNEIIKANFCINSINNDGGIYLGLGIRDKLKQVSFYPNLFQLGHGCYLVHNKGNSFSHYESDINNKSITPKFKEKQIIQIIVDTINQSITWNYYVENNFPAPYSQQFVQFNIKKVMKFSLTDDCYLAIGLYGEISVRILNVE